MDGSEGSLQQILNILEVFGSLSGLKMNMSKTKMIWIGKKWYSQEKIQCGSFLNWGENLFTLLGINFDINLDNMPLLNYSRAIQNIDNIITTWMKQHLTPLGKIAVIKTFIMAQLNHLLMVVPLPNGDFIDMLNKKLYKFLWNGKPKKIKRTIVLYRQRLMLV